MLMKNEKKYSVLLKISALRFIPVYLLISCISIFTGCSKDGDNTVVNPSQSLPTITGKVVDYNGTGLGNIKVETVSGTVRTSADGSFIIQNVLTPYEINLYSNDYRRAATFKNLTTTNPVFTIDEQNTNSDNRTEITVTIPQYNSNQRAIASFYNDSGFYKSDQNFMGYNYGKLTHYWVGNNVVSGKITVWVYTTDNQGRITSFDKYGEKPLTITNGINTRIVFNDIDLNTNPADSVISGSVITTNSSSIQFANIGMNKIHFGNLNSYGAMSWNVTNTNLNFSSFVPVLSDNVYKYYIYLRMFNNELRSGGEKVAEITPGGSNVITFNTIPTLLTPADNDQNVNYTTKFSFTNDSPKGIYKLGFYYYRDNSYIVARYIYLNTDNSNLSILSDTTFSLTDNITGDWYVTKYTGFNNVDDFVSIPLYNNPKYKEVLNSESRNFKIKLSNK